MKNSIVAVNTPTYTCSYQDLDNAPFFTPHPKLKLGPLSSISYTTMKLLFTLALSVLKVNTSTGRQRNSSLN